MNYPENASVAADMQGLPTMRWGAIFGGWLVATGIASLMYVAGLAMGFSAFDPNNAEAAAKGFGLGTAAWMVLTWAVSLFLGGMFASWFDGRSDQTVGALHGITVWGMAVTVSGLLLALGLSQVIQGGAALAKGAGTGMAVPQAANRSSSGQGADGSQAQNSSAAQPGAPGAGTQPLDRQPTPAAKEAAARYTAMAMWAIFVTSLIALVAAGIGGWLGAGHIHRVHHLRRYETAGARSRSAAS